MQSTALRELTPKIMTSQATKRQRHPHPSYLSRHESLERPLLVVEDQRALAAMLAAMLHERWGCEVDVADSLQSARELLAAGKPYFVACCDLNLPDAPDGEVIDLLAEANIPTIAVTAAFGGDMRQRMIDKGVVDYVLKNSINAYAYVCDLVGFIRKNQMTKALIVDDDRIVRKVLGNILRRFRMQVIEAGDGQEALRLAAQHKDLRLAILDYQMEGMDGIRLTAALRQEQGKERLAIIGISSDQDRLIGAEFLKNGANDFFAKPIAFEEVICRVNQNLEMLNLIEENHNAAYRDYLTGLPNRRSFFVDGPYRLEQARKADLPVAVAMLDIDHFKRINDTHGHDTGDEALCHVAALLASAFPASSIARLGGEEFGVLLTGDDAGNAFRLLDEFRATLASSPLDLDEHSSIRITTSVGLAGTVANGSEDLDALLSAADAKLYAAKAGGRNRVEA